MTPVQNIADREHQISMLNSSNAFVINISDEIIVFWKEN